MKFLFVLSGPVCGGKSSFCDEFARRFGAVRLSTRTILTGKGVDDERGALQAAGDKLDNQTDGKWVSSTTK